MTEEASKTKLRKQKANLSYRVAIIFDTLKETLDKVALLIKFGVKGVFHLEIGFVWNTNLCPALLKVRTNFIARVSAVCENYLAFKFNSCKQFKHRLRVVNMSAGQDHV